MRQDSIVGVVAADRARLEAIVAARNSPQKHVWRARIILLTAAGLGTVEITRRSGKSKNCVWRWQERFMQEGVAGLLHDKTRPSRIQPLGAKVAQRVVALTQTDPPGETTHWTAGSMQRHRHQEFVRFLNAIEAEIPAGKIIHVILDNYGPHKHPKTRAWLDRHPRFVFHYTPTSCSWLNAVEGFFAKLSKRRLRRGVFRSIVDLQAAI